MRHAVAGSIAAQGAVVNRLAGTGWLTLSGTASAGARAAVYRSGVAAAPAPAEASRSLRITRSSIQCGSHHSTGLTG